MRKLKNGDGLVWFGLIWLGFILLSVNVSCETRACESTECASRRGGEQGMREGGADAWERIGMGMGMAVSLSRIRSLGLKDKGLCPLEWYGYMYAR